MPATEKVPELKGDEEARTMNSEKDRIKRLLCQLRDVQREATECEKSRSALRQRVADLKFELNKCRTLLDNMPQHVAFKDKDGIYISCNRSFANSLRIAAWEIAGKTDFDIYPPELAQSLKLKDERVMESGRIVEGEESFAEDKEERTIQLLKMPVRSDRDELLGILSISWNITEHRRVELAVEKAREFAQSIVDTIREPLLVLDEDMHIIQASRSFSKIFGVNPWDIEGKCIFDIGERQWDIPRLRELLEDIIPRAHSFDNFEVEHVFPTIGRRTMLLNARMIYRKANHTKIILLAFEDITERLEAEKKLNKMREEFLSTLTHDMKGPLSVMLGYLQLVQKPQFGPISEDKIKFVKMIRSSINTLLAMVQNIMHAAIIDNDHVTFAHEDFSLQVLIHELALDFEALAVLGEITLDFTCPEGTWVHADREKLHMVFYNLLSNAFRYTPPGGTIGIQVSPDHAMVTIRVTDTGKGIAESEHGKIFQKFTRVKGERRGTGMGLYIVRNIIQGHGSDIRFESSPGKGTKFVFSIEKGAAPEHVTSS
jgi:two-component system, cell cycle sensor histidine kinase PleC